MARAKVKKMENSVSIGVGQFNDKCALYHLKSSEGRAGGDVGMCGGVKR